MILGKQCAGCHVDKPLEDFYPHPSGRMGFTSQCKTCMAATAAAWRKANPERASRNAQSAHQRQMSQLHDTYVRRTIVQGTGLSRSAIPQHLVDLKREQLAISRLARELKQTINQLEN